MVTSEFGCYTIVADYYEQMSDRRAAFRAFRQVPTEKKLLFLIAELRGVSRGGAGAAPPGDNCTKLSWCKGDIHIKDNARA